MSGTFDSTFEKGNASFTDPFTFISNAGMVSGSVGNNANRVLIASGAFDSAAPTAIATAWDNAGTPQPMTQIGSTLSVGGGFLLAIFGLIAPNIGALTIKLTAGNAAGVSACLGAVSLYNCDQTTGWNDRSSATGISASATKDITTTAGNIVVAAAAVNNGATPTIASGTSAWIEAALNGNYMMAYKAAASGSETIAWTIGNVDWGILAVDVIAFGGGASVKVGSMFTMFQ